MITVTRVILGVTDSSTEHCTLRRRRLCCDAAFYRSEEKPLVVGARSTVRTPPEEKMQSGGGDHHIVRKVRRTTGPIPPGSLEAMAALQGDATKAAAPSERHRFRSLIEQQGTDVNGTLTTGFGKLQVGLDNAAAEVGCLTDAYASVSSRLQSSRAATDVLLERTKSLRNELQATERQSELAAAFRETYELTEAEEAVLNAPYTATHDSTDLAPLLAALERVHSIHQRAKALLHGRHQPLALQLTSLMAAHEERGYGHLYRWLVGQCHALPVPCPSAKLLPLGRAVELLRRRPSLLASCWSEASMCRRQPLLLAFSSWLAASSSSSDAAMLGGADRGDEAMLAPFREALVALRGCLVAEAALLGSIIPPEGAPEGVGTSSPIEIGQPSEDAAAPAAASAGQALTTPNTTTTAATNGGVALRAALASATEVLAAPLSRHVSILLSAPASPSLPTLCPQLAARHRLAALLQQHATAIAPVLGTSLTAASAAPTPASTAVAAAASSASISVPASPISSAPAAAATSPLSTASEAIPLVATLRSSAQSAVAGFELCRDALLAQLTQLADSAGASATRSATPGALMPSEAIDAGVAALEMLLEAHAATEEQSSSDGLEKLGRDAAATAAPEGGSDDAAAASEAQVQLAVRARCEATVDSILGALLTGCNATAARRRSAGPAHGGRTLGGVLSRRPAASVGLLPNERLILLLNSADAIRAAFTPRGAAAAAGGAGDAEAAGGVAAAGLKRMSVEVKELLSELARGAAQEMLDACGLGAKLAAIRTAEAQPHIAMAAVIGLEPLALGSTMRSFYSVLFRLGDALVPHAELILSPALRRQALALTARTIAMTHRHIHQLVTNPGSGYPAPAEILLHSPDEVETLLGVMGLR